MLKNKNEKEFLKNYDSSQFEKVSLTTDVAVFSVSDTPVDNYRKLNIKEFSILLIKRTDYPFNGYWSLVGGFVGVNESIDDATTRVIQTKTGLSNVYTEQLYTFGDVHRDPRMRIISTSYIALIDKNNLKDKLSDNAKWFNIYTSETNDTMDVVLKFNQTALNIKAKKKNNTFIVESSEGLAFDHANIILMALLRLRNKANYTDIVFNLLPKYFSLAELQAIYELILGKKLLAPAFRRTIASKIEKTSKQTSGAGHRPSVLFKYKGTL